MKTKSLGKKLVLYKSTISNLEHCEMEDIKGGTFTWTYCYKTCNCWTAYCPPPWSQTPDCPV